jgi:hypothetical protein
MLEQTVVRVIVRFVADGGNYGSRGSSLTQRENGWFCERIRAGWESF